MKEGMTFKARVKKLMSGPSFATEEDAEALFEQLHEEAFVDGYYRAAATVFGLLGMAHAIRWRNIPDHLHPNGRCTCGHEGKCAWCRIPCDHGFGRFDYCDACADEADAAMATERQGDPQAE